MRHLSLAQIKRPNKKTAKMLAVLVLAILLACPPLVDLFVTQANAAGLTHYNVQINNSQANASGVTYTFDWTTSATTAIAEIDIQICTTPSGTCSAPSSFSTGTPTLSSSNIAGSSITTTGSTANLFKLNVGSPASQSTPTKSLTFTGVHNPSTINTTYYARTTTYSDAGSTVIDGPTSAAFAVLDTNSIAVSATVDPNFTFTVARAVSGNVNGNYSGSDAINVSTTTNNSIPFGTLNTSTASVSAHDITITTNAGNGYEVTASSSAVPPLNSGTDNIDSFTGTNGTPTTWSSPNGSSPDVNTGFFGYTSSSNALCTGTANRFTDNSSYQKYAGFSITGGEVACSTTPKNSDTTRVGWKLEINNIQPAGQYTGSIILVATPTY